MKLQLWAGTQQSYELTLAAEASITLRMGMASPFDGMPELPKLLSVQGNVGVITVSGSLINGNAGFLSYFGVVGYGDIRDALVAAMMHKDVQSILLNIDSGGGSVSGCQETHDLIARCNTLKPVVSYTGGVQASAALWIGVASSYSFTAPTAMTGSLGVMMVHAERSKALADAGIKVTVIRAGESKALANNYEPLTDKAKADKTAQAQALYDIFLGSVATDRGMSVKVAEASFGQGVEFIGKQAVDAGLFDAVGSFEDAYMKAADMGTAMMKKKPAGTMKKASMSAQADSSANSTEVLAALPPTLEILADNSSTSEGFSMPTPLTQEQLAAMAAGVDLSVVEPAAEAQGPKTTPDDSAATAELAAAQASLAELTSKLEASDSAAVAMKASMEAAEATATALGAIVSSSLKLMAMNLKTELKADMSLTELAAEHTKVSAQFKEKFKVGGVAATNTIEERPVAKAAIDPLFLLAAKSLK